MKFQNLFSILLAILIINACQSSKELTLHHSKVMKHHTTTLTLDEIENSNVFTETPHNNISITQKTKSESPSFENTPNSNLTPVEKQDDVTLISQAPRQKINSSRHSKHKEIQQTQIAAHQHIKHRPRIFGEFGHAFGVIGLVFIVTGILLLLIGGLIIDTIGVLALAFGFVFLLVWLIFTILQGLFDVIL
jgi:hypothetical protein